MNFLAVSFKFLSLLGGFATVGVILAMAFLLLDHEGKLSTSGEKLRTIFKVSATVWVVGAIGTIVFTLAQILATPLSGALDLTVLRSFITQITLGRYLAFQAVIAGIVLAISFSAKKILTLIFAMIIALVALVAPAFQSHSASGGSHSLVIGSLVIHVFALALWVGGVFALGLLSEKDRAIAVPRFSQLALWSAVAVVISGGVNAWARLNFKAAWGSKYSYIVLAKVVATIALVAIGYLHRKNLEKKDSINWSGFAKLLTTEAIIMVVTVLMGSWLSSTGSPDRPGSDKYDAALSIVGVSTPPKPNLSRILWSYEPDALMIGILITMVALYVKGVMVLTKRGDKWPVGRTVSFALGIAVTDFATSGGLG
jgi:putative copper resistance protein D